MLRVIKGDMFQDEYDVLVNPVNTYGISGKGVAYACMVKFPENYLYYRETCLAGAMSPGNVLVYEYGKNPRYILNVATKAHWSKPSKLEWVEIGLGNIADFLYKNDIKTAAIPAIGAGLGGLKWEDVKEKMYSTLAGLNTEITIFEPNE